VVQYKVIFAGEAMPRLKSDTGTPYQGVETTTLPSPFKSQLVAGGVTGASFKRPQAYDQCTVSLGTCSSIAMRLFGAAGLARW
jgi:hypothetical protein